MLKYAIRLARLLPREARMVYAILGCRPGKVEKRVLLTATKIATQRAVQMLERVEERGETFRGYYEGVPVSVVPTGIGCPATAVVVEALQMARVRAIVRSDFAGALRRNIRLGDLLVADKAYTGDGTTKHYVKEGFVEGDRSITQLLSKCASERNIRFHVGHVWTTDALFRETKELLEEAIGLECIGIDMETSALFTVGGIHGIKCGSIMSVSDNPIAGKRLFNSITKKEVFEGLDLAVSVGLEALSRISI
ncbi:MAG: nucleoside phosphorylase [Candidatus Freyarchaeota archaeon]|nr:hypothetical protein [Candidatus Freyrarchaeum guaymaensis]